MDIKNSPARESGDIVFSPIERNALSVDRPTLFSATLKAYAVVAADTVVRNIPQPPRSIEAGYLLEGLMDSLDLAELGEHVEAEFINNYTSAVIELVRSEATT